MTPPSWFNDPYDCRIHPDFSLLKNPDYQQRFIQRMLDVHSTPQNRASMEADLHLLVAKEPEKLYERFNDTQLLAEQDKWLGLCCFSGYWKSLSQWAYYANDHKGFCVEYDLEQIEVSRLFTAGRNVIYTSQYPSLDPIDHFDT